MMAKVVSFKPVTEIHETEDSYVRVVVRDMALDLRIGLYESEKKDGRRQKVVVNVALYASTKNYLQQASAENIIDYSRVINALRAWSERPHTLLVETYVRELLDLCFAMPMVEACGVSIFKAEVCPESNGAGVEVFMRRADYEQLR
jgi:dihydroneopterin aldolase